MDAAANNTEATLGDAAAQMSALGGAGLPPPDAGNTTRADPNAIREPTVDEVRKEWMERVAYLTEQLNKAADHRTSRLREIAIDTAIRHHGGNNVSQGFAADSARIVQAAAVYFAFLDTGAVPA